MNALVFYITYPLLMMLSLLPAPVLTGFSRMIYFTMYYMAGYRKKVVRENLACAFPDKSPGERRQIEKRFYRSLSALIMQTVKSFTISRRALQRRVQFLNAGLPAIYTGTSRNILLVLGHYGNWEWAGGAMTEVIRRPLHAAYKPLHNRYFDRLLFNSRSRLRVHLIEKRKLIRYLEARKQDPFLLVLIADQSPNPKNYFLTRFLNQETAVVTGMENIARHHNCVVIYAGIHARGNNRYAVDFRLLTDEPMALPEQELTKRFMMELEKDIYADPALYLWSHRRWKLTRKKSAALI